MTDIDRRKFLMGTVAAVAVAAVPILPEPPVAPLSIYVDPDVLRVVFGIHQIIPRTLNVLVEVS